MSIDGVVIPSAFSASSSLNDVRQWSSELLSSEGNFIPLGIMNKLESSVKPPQDEDAKREQLIINGLKKFFLTGLNELREKKFPLYRANLLVILMYACGVLFDKEGNVRPAIVQLLNLKNNISEQEKLNLLRSFCAALAFEDISANASVTAFIVGLYRSNDVNSGILGFMTNLIRQYYDVIEERKENPDFQIVFCVSELLLRNVGSEELREKVKMTLTDLINFGSGITTAAIYDKLGVKPKKILKTSQASHRLVDIKFPDKVSSKEEDIVSNGIEFSQLLFCGVKLFLFISMTYYFLLIV